MAHYTYTDWSKGPVVEIVKQSWRGGIPWSAGPYHEKHAGEVVFQCDALDILVADAELLAATGIVAAKAMMVGCSIAR